METQAMSPIVKHLQWRHSLVFKGDS